MKSAATRPAATRPGANRERMVGRRGPRPAFEIALLIFLSLIAWSNSFQAGFVLDNRGLILNDPRIREASAANFGLIVNHTYWWPNGESGLYRPFATLSYLFNYAILGNGAQPAGYHWLNFLLHAGNVLLAYLLAIRLTARRWPAFFIAAVWAVHPVLTESVTNIVGRADLLAAAGVLGGLLLYLKAVDASGSRRAARLIALAAVTAIGVFSKESGVILITAILLYELTFRRKWSRAQVMALAAVAIPTLWMLWQRRQVLAATRPMEIPFTDNPIAWASFGIGRLTAFEVIGRYFARIVWPATLSADYSWSQIPLFGGHPQEWLAVIGAGGVLALTAWLYRANREAFFFLALGLLWLLPAANLLFPTGTIMAERLVYLTALGVAACIVPGVYAVSGRSPKLAPAVLWMLIAALAVRTWMRNRDWKDDLTIARASVVSSPKSFKTHDLLANVLFAENPSGADLDRVIAESEKSIAILEPLPVERRPADPYWLAANAWMQRGAYAKAIPALETYTAIRNREPEGYLMLSTARLNTGDTAKAAQAAARARELAPLDARVYGQTAEIDASSGKLGDAAVALIEGIFVTGDSRLRRDLVELYRRATDPRSCMLSAGPNGPAINPACPAVHAQACAASDYVVKTLAAAGRSDLAEARRRMFQDQFHCALGSPERE